MMPSRRHEDPPARGALRALSSAGGTSDTSSLRLDLLRGDLYRMLDELARAPGLRHRLLVREFERAWRSYKEATRGS